VFERFTEEARRCLFFARRKTTERNGFAITDEDLLHGISLAAPAAIELLGENAAAALRSPESGEQYWTRIQDDREVSIRGQKEIPFSQDAKCVLQFATEEADSLRHKDIGPEHLLLGLLRDETTNAWRRLHPAGVRLPDFRLRVNALHEGS
jgi:ATP-dependent Clp protease ATP-binding subunit ClpA